MGVSKTDQEGAGALLFISRQTMRDLGAIRPLGAGDQLVFGLKPKAIGKRIAAAATAAGQVGAYSGHSARVGMARDLARAGEELPALMTARTLEERPKWWRGTSLTRAPDVAQLRDSTGSPDRRHGRLLLGNLYVFLTERFLTSNPLHRHAMSRMRQVA